MPDPERAKALKAQRWQRYYWSHRGELLKKYRVRYVRRENQRVDDLIKERGVANR